MARYSREQRRRAAELYEQYGQGAADVIRELGYLSREVLAVRIDELAPGERVIKRSPVADEVKRTAVAQLAVGGVTSREVAAGWAWRRRP